MLLALLCVAACACGSGVGSAQAEELSALTLGENIFVDGVNVSNMRFDAAVAALDETHAKMSAALNFTVIIDGEEVLINGARLPIAYNTKEVLQSAAALKKYYPQKNTPRTFSCTVSADAEALRAALQTLLSPYNIAPQNASASFDTNAEGRFQYALEQNGRQIDVVPLAAQMKAAIEGGGETCFEAAIQTLFPTYTLAMAKADHALVSEFSTSFKGSVYGKNNRVFNIEKAASLINGIIVAPGAEFDMNLTIGDRNAENGWKEAAAIRDATYVQEYGGGVCQVSTTLYNAVLMADLSVTERWHHSWPLGYVPIGRDATISTGGPNFKFQNNTAANIVICAYVNEEDKTIHVELYGRKNEAGVTIKLKSYKVQTLESLGEDLILDDTLPYNTREVVREERIGSVAETYKEYYDAAGNLVNKVLVVRDKYRSVKGISMVSRDLYYGYTVLPNAPQIADAP